MENYYGAAFGFFGIGWILVILFWILVILAIVTVLRWIFGHGKMHGYGCRCYKCEEKENMMREGAARRDDEYMRILKERYARGEMNKEDFEQKKRDLMM